MVLVSRVVLGPGLSKALNTSAVDSFPDCSTIKHPLAVVFLRNSAVTIISPSSLTLVTVALWTSYVAVEETHYYQLYIG